jgi:polysaccharide biosynthesis protein PslG
MAFWKMTRADLLFCYRAGRVARWLWDRRGIGARLILAGWLLSLLAPAPPYLLLGPPQQVQTEHPITCVHTRLDLEVTDLNVYRTLALTRQMGASAIVNLFYWAYLEPRQGVYDWEHADRLINMAHHQGLKVIARLGIVPDWARPDAKVKQTSLNYLTPDYFDEYAQFVGAFAARYRGKADWIIPWNEPNLTFEWGGQNISPAQYVDLLRAVYAAAHAANPDVEILGGAMAPTLAQDDQAMNDVLYLEAMYEAGAKAYFDALAVHTYGFTLPASDPPAIDRLNFRRTELLLAVMRRFGDGQKPVYITETGWNDHPRWIHAVPPGLRVAYTLDSLAYAERAWPSVRNMCFWYFRSPVLHRTYQDYFAFVTVDFRPRPIYEAVRQWTQPNR